MNYREYEEMIKEEWNRIVIIQHKHEVEFGELIHRDACAGG